MNLEEKYLDEGLIKGMASAIKNSRKFVKQAKEINQTYCCHL